MAIGGSGFVQLRRGLFEHVRDGRLSFFEASLYVAILSDTNPSTGLCYGSAGLFSVVYSVPTRTCRDALEKLEQKGYLRRFPTRGKHGSYPILVNKFRCSSGAMSGLYVNSDKSSSCDNIIYDIRLDGVNENVNDNGNDGVNDSAARVDTRDKKLESDKEQGLSPLLPTAPVDTNIRPEEFANTWNRLRGKLPKVDKFTDGRRKKVQARIRAGLTIERFSEAVENCRVKPFLMGENDSGWVATFDWLVKNSENIEKAITNPYGLNKPNGGYANGRSNDPRTVTQSVQDVIGRARAGAGVNGGSLCSPQSSPNGSDVGDLCFDAFDGIESRASEKTHPKVIEGMPLLAKCG